VVVLEILQNAQHKICKTLRFKPIMKLIPIAIEMKVKTDVTLSLSKRIAIIYHHPSILRQAQCRQAQDDILK